MKVFQAATPLLVQLAMANYNQMKEDYDNGVNVQRTITGADMGLINEYGCWCYFQEGHYLAKSGPVDAIDVLCKRLHDGYSCAMMDAKRLGFECIPWNVPYNSAIGSGLVVNMDLATIRQECDTQNPNTVSCENWACKMCL